MLCPQPSPKPHMPSRAVPSATPPPPGPAAPRVPRPSPRSPEEVSGVPRGENPEREPGAAEAGLEPAALETPGGRGGGERRASRNHGNPAALASTRPLARAQPRVTCRGPRALEAAAAAMLGVGSPCQAPVGGGQGWAVPPHGARAVSKAWSQGQKDGGLFNHIDDL